MERKKFEKLLDLIERYLPLFLMCAFIFIQSSRPSIAVSYVGWFNYFLHKLAHLIVFSLLFLFSARAFQDKKMALIFTILYAISDEYHQSFIATRTAAFSDVVIDSIAAGGIFYLSDKYQKKIPQVIRKFFHL
jgi:hypothetical protein